MSFDSSVSKVSLMSICVRFPFSTTLYLDKGCSYRVKLLARGQSIQCILGNFDRLTGSLRSVGAFPIFDRLVSRKWLVIQQNGRKYGPQFGPRGLLFKCALDRACLTVKCLGQSGVIWRTERPFCSFPIFDNIVSRNFPFSITLYLESHLL